MNQLGHETTEREKNKNHRAKMIENDKQKDLYKQDKLKIELFANCN